MLPVRRILCPIDFSTFSYQALVKAGELASHFGAELCVLHVTQPLVTPSYPSITYIRKVPIYEKAVRDGAQQELKAVIARYTFSNVAIRPLARIGNPAHEIVRAAEEEDVDLIVIPTHGMTGWRQYVFGSVAENVLRLAHCPVLLWRVQTGEPNGLMLPPRKILCSTDFSEPSFAALKVAEEWATNFGTELGLIHVVKPPESPPMVLWREQIEETLQVDALQQIHLILRERLPQLTKARAIVRQGSAADEIAAAVAEEDADLLIIATSGASSLRSAMAGTPIERLLFGSIATNVLRLTTCPILTVRMSPDAPVSKAE